MVRQVNLSMNGLKCPNMFKDVEEYTELVSTIYFHSWTLHLPMNIQS